MSQATPPDGEQDHGAERDALIERNDAFEIIGPLLFGKKWRPLSSHDQDLIRLYIIDRKVCPSTLAKALDRARHRQDLWEAQVGQVIDWLEKRGFDCVPRRTKHGRALPASTVKFAKDDLDAVIARDFGAAPVAAAPFSRPGLVEFIRNYIDTTDSPSQDRCINALYATGKSFIRKAARDEYDSQIAKGELSRSAVARRRKNSQKNNGGEFANFDCDGIAVLPNRHQRGP